MIESAGGTVASSQKKMPEESRNKHPSTSGRSFSSPLLNDDKVTAYGVCVVSLCVCTHIHNYKHTAGICNNFPASKIPLFYTLPGRIDEINNE